MWEKIKTVLSIAGAVLSVLFFTVLLFVLRRGKADGRGSDGTDERDSRIEERIDSAGDAIARCEEHLQRAEELLRGAVERSRKEESKS